jgi:hypothetical protein
MRDTSITELPPHLQRMVNYDINGLDIMHGELKNLMLIWEKELENAQEIEDESGDAMDSMERKYCEGFLDSLVALYNLTYQLSFQIGIRKENRKDGHL